MGIYLNPGGEKFKKSRRSEIYVDKSELLAYLNQVIDTENRFVCVSRPRRFGKSMAANMIAAYYDRTAETEAEFLALKIGGAPSFNVHLGKYDVIHINVQGFVSEASNIQELLVALQKAILWDLLEVYSYFRYFDNTKLIRTMSDIYRNTKRPFVIIIDEWDAIFREYQGKKDWHEKYLDFLRAWLKDQSYVGLAYMTGILPIKKYGTHSALNMFREFSMTDPDALAEYVGFTAAEVETLCTRFNMDLAECRRWYDGYRLEGVGAIYCPRSVVVSMESHKYKPYWNQTETFEALKVYIDMDYDGLREAVIALMAGDVQRINPYKFTNDMDTFHGKDDVLTLLVHLGYLGYDAILESVYIPNQEIMLEYSNAVEDDKSWNIVAESLKASDALLTATLAKDSEAVAKGIEAAHLETSHITYNSEAALSYTLSLAYYTARQKYVVKREFPTGKGFADLVFIPRKNHPELPALILELKWDKSVNAAIKQIKERNYPRSVADFTGKLLLIGINYDKDTKAHKCVIEERQK
ncbi:MAG: AAA family ATPase [Selenomonadaceae bacterium]|nr:AAA family ATPase [Selenomonadaceae bacterium]